MHDVTTFLNSAGRSFVDFAAVMLLQSSVLILILLGLDFVLRRRVRAVVRYWLWMLVLLKLVLPTSLSLPTGLGYWFGDRLAELTPEKKLMVKEPEPRPAAPVIVTTETVTLEEAVTAPPPDVPAQPTPPAPAKSEPARPLPRAAPAMTWQGLVFLTWLAAAAAMMMLLMQRMFFVRGLVAQSKPAGGKMLDVFERCRQQMRVRRQVGLKLSPMAASPSVCGLFKSIILIPEGLAEKLDSQQLKSILLHELAHIKRGDLWVSFVQTLLQIAYIYSPLLWAANAVIRKVREQAVDEMVLAAMGDEAEDYPETLLNVSRLTFSRPALSLRLVGVVESKKALTSRIKHILSRPFPKTAKLGILGLLAIIIAAAILLPMAKGKRRIPIGINDTLNISDTSGQLKIKSITMPAPVGKGILDRNVTQLSIGVVNDSEQDLYLGLEYYEDAGRVGLFSPGALGRAYIRKVPKNWSGQVHFQIDYIRFVAGGNLQLKLAKCPAPKTSYCEGNLIFLPVNDAEILFEKKYILVPKNNDEKSALQTAPDRKAFTSTLANGVTVELVGVCEYPIDDNQWWRPDGTPLTERPYDKTEHAAELKNRLVREFATRFLYEADEPIGIKWDATGGQGNVNDYPLRSGQKVKDIWMSLVDFPKTQDKCAVRVGAANGRWQTRHKANREELLEQPAEDPLVETFVLKKSEDENIQVSVRIILDKGQYRDEQWQIVAFDTKGKIHKGLERAHSTGSTTTRTYQGEFRNLRFEDLKDVRFRTRPYEWVSFKNVSLRPGFRTDVEVEIAEPAGERDLIIRNNMAFYMPVYDRNASNFGRYIGGNLTRFDTDYVTLERYGLKIGASPEEVFEKQGRCAFYMKAGHEFVPIRGTVIAPVSIPDPAPERKHTMTFRISRLSQDEIINQIRTFLGGNLTSRPITLEDGATYAVISPEKKLMIMKVNQFTRYATGAEATSLTFFDLDKVEDYEVPDVRVDVEDAASEAERGYKATLSNGVTVELIADSGRNDFLGLDESKGPRIERRIYDELVKWSSQQGYRTEIYMNLVPWKKHNTFRGQFRTYYKSGWKWNRPKREPPDVFLKVDLIKDGIWYVQGIEKQPKEWSSSLRFALLVAERGQVSEDRYDSLRSEARKRFSAVRKPNPKWTTTLSNGTKVELAGISNFPSPGKEWWGPDGSPIGYDPVFHISEYGVAHQFRKQSGVNRLEVAFAISWPECPNEHKIVQMFADDVNLFSRRGFLADNEVVVQPIKFAVKQKTFNVKIRISTDGKNFETATYKNVFLKPNFRSDAEDEAARERVSQMIGAALPESVENVKLFSASFEASVVLCRFDIPKEDLKVLLEKSKRFPEFSRLVETLELENRWAEYRYGEVDWWRPEELKEPVYGQWRASERAPGGEGKVWVVQFVDIACGELANGLMRVYLQNNSHGHAVEDQAAGVEKAGTKWSGQGQMSLRLLVPHERVEGLELVLFDRDRQRLVNELATHGPGLDDNMCLWFESACVLPDIALTDTYQGKQYVLTSKSWQVNMGREVADGAGLVDVRAVKDEGDNWAVEYELCSDAHADLQNMALQYAGHNVGVVVDGKVLSTFTLEGDAGPKGKITGDYNQRQAEALAETLRAGSPALREFAYKAIGAGDLEKVKKLLAQNPYLLETGCKCTDGRRPLLEAVLVGKIDIVGYLLEQGADVNAKGEQPEGQFAGTTALHKAAEYGTREMVELLVSYGANVNAIDGQGFTPLAMAASRAKPGPPVEPDNSIIEYLISSGADVNAEGESGLSALTMAVMMQGYWKGQPQDERAEPRLKSLEQTIELLLASGAEKDIFSAAGLGDTERVAAILEQDPSTVSARRAFGMEPLQMAVIGGHRETVRLLVERGANVFTYDVSDSPFRYAAMVGDLEMFKLLEQLRDKYRDRMRRAQAEISYYREAMNSAIQKGHSEIVAHLVDQERDIKAGLMEYGLLEAAGEGQVEVVRILLERGGQVYASAALYKAAESVYDRADPDATMERYIAIAKLLIESGADVNWKYTTGATPLLRAAYNLRSYGHKSVNTDFFELLREKGADVNVACRELRGELALICAVRADNLELAAMLLEAGADPLAAKELSGRDRTVLEIAREDGSKEMVELLAKYAEPGYAELNKRFEGTIKEFVEAVTKKDDEALMLVTSARREYDREQWPKRADKIRTDYEGHYELLDQMLGVGQARGFAAVFIARPESSEQKYSKLLLMQFPDGGWRVLQFHATDDSPDDAFKEARKAYESLDSYQRAVFDAAGMLEEVAAEIPTGMTTEMPDQGRLTVRVKDGNLRFEFVDQPEGRYRAVEVHKDKVKCWRSKNLLGVAEKLKLEKGDLRLEAKDGKATLSAPGKQYVIDAHEGKVRVQYEGKVLTGDRFTFELPSLQLQQEKEPSGETGTGADAEVEVEEGRGKSASAAEPGQELYEGRTIEQWMSRWDSEEYDDVKEAKEMFVRIGRPAVPAMIRELKKRSNYGWHAVGVLMKMGPEAEEALAVLIEAALDKELRFGDGRQSPSAYRGTVLYSLSNMTWARDRVVGVLQGIAEDDQEDDSVRASAIWALTNVGKEARPILEKLTETEQGKVRDRARNSLAELLEKEEGLSKEDYYRPLIEKDPFDASVPSYLTTMKGVINYGRPHALTQKIKQLYRDRLAKEPDAQLAWQLATIIDNGLRNTGLQWAAPAEGGKGHWTREDPAENFATLAEALETVFAHAEADSELRVKAGIALAKLRLLQGDWAATNAVLEALGKKPIPAESRPWLPAPPVDWEKDLSQWTIADESMRSGNCSLEFTIEKDGKGLEGVHFLVKRAPEPTNVLSTGWRADTLFFAPHPLGGSRYSFGYMGNDRALTRYAVSDESGVVRFDKLPNIPVKVEVLVPTGNFEEAGSDWELWMEVAPGKFKIAKMYGGADAVGGGWPPDVEELRQGETVHYPRLAVRPAFGFNVADWDSVSQDFFMLSWQGLDASQIDKGVRYELEMFLSAPDTPNSSVEHAPVVKSAKMVLQHSRRLVGPLGVGGLRLGPGNIYMFEVRAVDESGAVVARWPRTRVWVPWGYRESEPPFTWLPYRPVADRYNTPPAYQGLYQGSWWKVDFEYEDGRKETLREKVTRFVEHHPNIFEYEYVCLRKAWIDWSDGDLKGARGQLEKLAKDLPKGSLVHGTAEWLLKQMDAEQAPPQRLKFVPDDDYTDDG